MPTQDYYLKQAETAARLALVESDPEKARVLHILALEFFDKAEKKKTENLSPKVPIRKNKFS